MANFKDILTTDGQRLFSKMLTGEVEKIRFSKVMLGDGNASGELSNIKELVNPICEAEIEKISMNSENNVMITSVFSNESIAEGFYLREKGIYATDGTKEVLVLYANNGSAAQWIAPPEADVYRKIMRSVILFSQSDKVNIEITEDGYALAIDLEDHIAICKSHMENKSNPHVVTKVQVGLGSVDNKSSATIRGELTKANVTAGLGYTPVDSEEYKNHVTDNLSHTANKSNPHTVTKAQVGLGNVDNKSSATIRGEITKTNVVNALGYTPPATDTTYPLATTSANGLMSSVDKTKLNGIEAGAQVNQVLGVKGNAESSYRTGNVNITPTNIGLGNVPNVKTNDQAPTYTEAATLTELTSTEKLSVAFGKISKAVSSLIGHLKSAEHLPLSSRLNSMASIISNTDSSKVAGALAVKELNSNLSLKSKITQVEVLCDNAVQKPCGTFYNGVIQYSNIPSAGRRIAIIPIGAFQQYDGNYVATIGSWHRNYVRIMGQIQTTYTVFLMELYTDE